MTSPSFREDWRSHAACTTASSWTFHQRQPDVAKAVCGRCPVRPECLHDALVTDAPHGVWGGLSHEERTALPALPSGKTEALEVLRTLLDEADATDDQPVPGPRPNGVRYTPEERAVLEPRTIELLRAGASYSEITAALGITAPTIVRIRRKAGLPASGRTGTPPSRTKAEVLADHVEPYGDGHARWTGPMSGRMPQLHAEQERFNARHVVFEEHHGRHPIGYVRSGCGIQACIAGAHLTDDLMRDTVQPSAPRRRSATPSEGTSPVTTTPSPADDLLKWAEEHTDAKVQAAAARIREDLAGLRHRYDADHELTVIARQKAKLEAQLAALAAREAELAPTRKRRKSGSNARDYDTRTVRAWAVENDIDCPPVGQIPKRVLDAWRTANPKTDGGTP